MTGEDLGIQDGNKARAIKGALKTDTETLSQKKTKPDRGRKDGEKNCKGVKCERDEERGRGRRKR